MLEQAFQDVYTKFKLHFYQNVFQRFATREATLTTVESFCMEGIMAMGEPTIAEFSRMMQISTPNAAYKIGSLVKKGYVEKIQSTTDRREYHLRPTQKYIDYYNISYSYLHTVVERAKASTAISTPCAVWGTTSSCGAGAAAATGWPAAPLSFLS